MHPTAILLIEDDPGHSRLVREFLSEQLEDSFSVLAADRLAKGLEVLDSRKVDVVVLDLSLPDSVGLETLAKVRAKAPQTPVIILSGSDDSELAVSAVRAGADDYLPKSRAYGETLARSVRHAIERQRVKEALRASEARYATLVAIAGEGIWQIDPTHDTRLVNDKLAELLDWSTDEMVGKPFLSFVHPDDQAAALDQLRARDDRSRDRVALRFVRRDGNVLHATVACSPIPHAEAAHADSLLILTSVTELTKPLGLGDEAKELTAAGRGVTTAELAETGAWPLRVLLVEDIPAQSRLLRELLREVGSRAPSELVVAETLAQATTQLSAEQFSLVLLDLSLPDSVGLDTFRAIHARAPQVPIIVLSGTDDEELAVAAVMAGAQDYLVKSRLDGELLARAMRYAVQRKQSEQKLVYLATHDAVTGLPNRTLLLDRLAQAVGQAQRRKGRGAVLFVDLDRFKLINDTLGHDAGDQMLLTVRDRMLSAVRKTDTVARLGGDEFIVLMAEVAREEDVGILARRMLKALSAPVVIKGQEIAVSCSIGGTTFPRDAVEPEQILKNADIAMYRAKEGGRNRFCAYAEDLNARVQEKLVMERSLVQALAAGEFCLHYQPQIDARTRRVTGVEALLRWSHPQRGLLFPDEFVPLAEETGQMRVIGEWVLATACRQVKEWNDARSEPLNLAVNLSARELLQSDAAQTICAIVAESGLDPRCLTIETSERKIVQYADEARAVFDRLKEFGIAVSLERFGAGGASLAWLGQSSVSSLKIDQSFVQQISSSADSRALAHAVIALAHALGLRVVAQGVETYEQSEFLSSSECDALQGRLFCSPVPAAALPQAIAAGSALLH